MASVGLPESHCVPRVVLTQPEVQVKSIISSQWMNPALLNSSHDVSSISVWSWTKSSRSRLGLGYMDLMFRLDLSVKGLVDIPGVSRS